jgi:hypothetical protein
MTVSKSLYDVLLWGSGVIGLGPLVIALIVLRFGRSRDGVGLFVRVLPFVMPFALIFAYLHFGAAKVVELREQDGEVTRSTSWHLGLAFHWHDHTRLVNHTTREVVVVEVAYEKKKPSYQTRFSDDDDEMPPYWLVEPGQTFELARDIGYFGPDDLPPEEITVDASASSANRYWVTWDDGSEDAAEDAAE